ncbi:antirestriction protein ArdR [Pseudomonas gingeri NCPPB 3146 = LMG 5327]|uniref:Antirestriction protein ArdR n=2 Tax=Pseudomonas gingeri TaxID=117681 RepID=A0A7Y7Y6F4_9PSED|nr:antirestriction protein ArdR [Pseudomonas gingeri]NWC18723.1 antirestriction protein ArdR [Pseudomonas gingeri]PNQ91103.1 antirestriction protein ArdR [Pseudomonas gingeri NCPPB 3146 = LMG 5327]
MQHSIADLRKIARVWRKNNAERAGGIVCIWEGSAYCWKNELRDPDHERPGVFAVLEDGQVFIAEGGDYSNGAKQWAEFAPAANKNPA